MNDARAEMFDFPQLETERLVLRVLTADDAAAVHRHFSDEAVTRHMDIDVCASVAEARAIIAFHVEDSGCRWGLFEKPNGALVGTCGYHCWRRGRRPSAEIGFDLGRSHWGRGLMQEALRSVIRFGFAAMALHRIDAEVEPGNARSIALLRRLGFRSMPATRGRPLLFALGPDEWRAREHPRP